MRPPERSGGLFAFPDAVYDTAIIPGVSSES